MMVGAEVARRQRRHGHVMRGRDPPGGARPAARAAPARPFAALKDNLDVRAGEVLGIAGVAGNGQGELFDALSGERQASADDAIVIAARPVGQARHHRAGASGAAFVPEERLGHGAHRASRCPRTRCSPRMRSDRGLAAAGSSIRCRGGRASKRIGEGDGRAQERRDPEAGSLSGGNLQKFIVGRELLRKPARAGRQPADLGRRCRRGEPHPAGAGRSGARGSAVLVISQDLDEIFEIADRIAVIHDGRLSSLSGSRRRPLRRSAC
jgi:ABC-type uncharacterized transport system ATPase subunit